MKYWQHISINVNKTIESVAYFCVGTNCCHPSLQHSGLFSNYNRQSLTVVDWMTNVQFHGQQALT